MAIHYRFLEGGLIKKFLILEREADDAPYEQGSINPSLRLGQGKRPGKPGKRKKALSRSAVYSEEGDGGRILGRSEGAALYELTFSLDEGSRW